MLCLIRTSAVVNRQSILTTLLLRSFRRDYSIFRIGRNMPERLLTNGLPRHIFFVFLSKIQNCLMTRIIRVYNGQIFPSMMNAREVMYHFLAGGAARPFQGWLPAVFHHCCETLCPTPGRAADQSSAAGKAAEG